MYIVCRNCRRVVAWQDHKRYRGKRMEILGEATFNSGIPKSTPPSIKCCCGREIPLSGDVSKSEKVCAASRYHYVEVEDEQNANQAR